MAPRVISSFTPPAWAGQVMTYGAATAAAAAPLRNLRRVTHLPPGRFI